MCAHRPIFDTLDVLTVHRAGKKHMGSKWEAGSGVGCAQRVCPPHPLCFLPGLQRFYGRKRSLQDVAQKRQHEEEVQAEEAGMQVGVDAPSSPRWTSWPCPPELCPLSPGFPSTSSGTDEADRPECSAESSSLQ